jgi:methionyl aminopeptidase
MARTIGVEEIAADAREFLETTRKALERATVLARPGNTVGDLGNAIESTVTEKGFSVVREMVGHGVGENLHEDPAIPGFGFPGSGPKLQKGQTIAVEAIINQGEDEIVTSREDNWTTWTKDGKLSALFENTIVVLETPEVLTQLDVDIVI